jgi:hypothetical protein
LYADRGGPEDPEIEKQISMAIMRDVSNYRMKRELEEKEKREDPTNPS